MKRYHKKKSLKADRLIDIIRTVTGVDPEQNSRVEDVVMARNLFFKIIRDVEGWNYADMGSIFNRDHATASHGKKTLENLMPHNNDLAAKYHRVLNIFVNSEIIDTDILQKELYGKIVETNDLIKQQNAYIAEMKSEISNMKQEIKMVSERNMDYAPIIDTLLNRLPKGKIDKAHSKIKAVLNGL